MDQLNELGFYVLAGAPQSRVELIEEVKSGEVLGLGRGIAPLFDAYGIPRITTAQIEDFVRLMRRLWHGEVVFGHDGPAGTFPVLHLDATFDEDIPLSFVAFGRTHSHSRAGASTRSCCTHTSPTRRSSVVWRRCAPRPTRRVATPRRCASGRATRPSTTICPKRRG